MEETLTESAVHAALRRYEDLFESGDIEGIVGEFTDDAVVRYGASVQLRGKDNLRAMLQERFASMREYRLSKRLEFIAPPRIAASWTGSWRDPSGTRMQSLGIELLTMREGKISDWLASVSVWRADEREIFRLPKRRHAAAVGGRSDTQQTGAAIVISHAPETFQPFDVTAPRTANAQEQPDAQPACTQRPKRP